MSEHCCAPIPHNEKYRKVLWVIMLLNALMFFVEIGAGVKSNSSSLLADALDFAGDASNIAISLFVLTKSTTTRAKASLLKAGCMFLFGIYVLGNASYHLMFGSLPKAEIMGTISILALLTNLLGAGLLYHYRQGDSNMTSVWLCTRNDAIGNVLVMLAALAVYLTSSNISDSAVAAIMVLLGLTASYRIARHALVELRG